eukprot:jgi/Mesen1/498/ME000104S10585
MALRRNVLALVLFASVAMATAQYLYEDGDTTEAAGGGRRLLAKKTGEDILAAAITKANVSTPHACVIDGGGKHQIFTTWYQYPGGLVLDNLVIQNALNSVVNGSMIFVARNVVFQNNVRTLPEGGAVTNCSFINNTAHNGHGGAIWSAFYSGGGEPSFGNTAFRGNRALNGAGGALKMGGTQFYCYKCTFENNYALQSGGAVRFEGYNNMTVYKSSFTNNTSGGFFGGAVAFSVAYARRHESRFCDTTFTANAAPKQPASRDVYLDFRYEGESDWQGPPGTINFCGGTAKPAVQIAASAKAKHIWTIGTNCTGFCSGCPHDCYGNGRCQLDQDLIPTCVCKNNYEPQDLYCNKCKGGSLLAKQCTGCEQGFIPLKNGSCEACPGLESAYFYYTGPSLKGLNYYKTAKSSAACKAECDARNKKFDSEDTYCNFWAFYGSKAPKRCAGACLLFYNDNSCYNFTINYDAKYDLYSQNDDAGLGFGCPIP